MRLSSDEEKKDLQLKRGTSICVDDQDDGLATDMAEQSRKLRRKNGEMYNIKTCAISLEPSRSVRLIFLFLRRQ